jgi:hypothetical protein
LARKKIPAPLRQFPLVNKPAGAAPFRAILGTLGTGLGTALVTVLVTVLGVPAARTRTGLAFKKNL